jgi:hypothetical protein
VLSASHFLKKRNIYGVLGVINPEYDRIGLLLAGLYEIPGDEPFPAGFLLPPLPRVVWERRKICGAMCGCSSKVPAVIGDRHG